MTTNGNDIVRTAASRQVIPVKCLENGITYKSAGEAGRILGLHAPNITHCCKGTRPSVKGMHFEYAKQKRHAEPTTETDSHIITIQNEAKLDVLGHRINRKCVSVTVKELNRSFDSVMETAAALGISPHAVSRALGDRGRTVAGFHVYRTSESKENMEEQQEYNRTILAEYEELKKEMEPYFKWKKEQELARKEEEERKQKLAKLHEKLERRQRIRNRKAEELMRAEERCAETEMEIAELEGR